MLHFKHIIMLHFIMLHLKRIKNNSVSTRGTLSSFSMSTSVVLTLLLAQDQNWKLDKQSELDFNVSRRVFMLHEHLLQRVEARNHCREESA